jgi:hypothetical protein
MERTGDCCAKAARGAGDKRGLPCEIEHCSSGLAALAFA